MKDVNEDRLWDADVTASAEILESVVSSGSFRLFHFSSSLSGNAVRRSLCSEETVNKSFISVPSACFHTAFSTETTQTLGVLNRLNIVSQIVFQGPFCIFQYHITKTSLPMAISNVWTQTLDCQSEPRTLMQLAVRFGQSLPGYSAGYDPKFP